MKLRESLTAHPYRILYLAIAFVSIFAGTLMRIAAAYAMPWTVDDLVVPFEIIYTALGRDNYLTSVLARIDSSSNFVTLVTGEGLTAKIASLAFDLGLLVPLISIKTYVDLLFSIPSATTFPIAHYPVLVMVGEFCENDCIAFASRLINVVEFIVIALMTFKALKDLKESDNYIAIHATFLSIFSLSTGAILYSGQAFPYHASYLIFPALMLLFLRPNRFQYPYRAGFFLGLAFNFSYLSCVFVIAFLLTAGVSLKRVISLTYMTKFSVVYLLIALPSIYFLIPDIGSAKNWNAGSGDIYLLTGIGGITKLPYALHELSYALINPFGETLAGKLFAFSSLLFISVGTIHAFRSSLLNPIGLFAAISALLYMSLSFAGVISFGPSRHSLIIAPPFLYLGVMGGHRLFTKALSRMNTLDAGHLLAHAILLCAVSSTLIIVSTLISKNEIENRMSSAAGEFSNLLSGLHSPVIVFHAHAFYPAVFLPNYATAHYFSVREGAILFGLPCMDSISSVVYIEPVDISTAEKPFITSELAKIINQTCRNRNYVLDFQREFLLGSTHPVSLKTRGLPDWLERMNVIVFKVREVSIN